MRKLSAVAAIALAALAFLSPSPADAGVDVNVNIGIPFPGFHVEAPPEMVLVPDAPVYFAPRVSVDLFFYDGFWFTRNEGHWYRGPDYRGPWKMVHNRYVPAPVYRMRPDYREHWGRGEHVPYGQLKKHWREHRVREDGRRDRAEYRERHEERGERDWKEEKRERKHEEKEWKEEGKHGKGNGKGHGKGHDD